METERSREVLAREKETRWLTRVNRFQVGLYSPPTELMIYYSSEGLDLVVQVDVAVTEDALLFSDYVHTYTYIYIYVHTYVYFIAFVFNYVSIITWDWMGQHTICMYLHIHTYVLTFDYSALDSYNDYLTQ